MAEETVVVTPQAQGAGSVVTGGGHHGYHRDRGIEGKDAVLIHATDTASASRDTLQTLHTNALFAFKDRSDSERFSAQSFARADAGIAETRFTAAINAKEVAEAVRDEGRRTRELMRDQHAANLAAQLAAAQQELLILRIKAPA